MDTEKRCNSFSTRQMSSSARPKMKHLSQNSTSQAAMRFRLTFDETADAAANNTIALPDEVAPCSPVIMKRPSCICGEPELPSVYIPQESYSGSQQNDHCPLLTRVITPSCENPHENHLDESTISSYNVSQVHPPLASSALMDTTYQSDVGILSSAFCHSKAAATRSPIPSQPNQPHPHNITIRVSNSQQSFTPLLSDSPFPGDDYCHNCDHRDSFHVHADSCDLIRNNSITPSYPESHYEYRQNASSMSMNFNGNDQVPSEVGPVSPEHFQPSSSQTNTTHAPPIQDLYRYHVFFSHCPEDREWVEHMVAHLESAPFNYTCAYASVQDEADQSTLQQRILCAAMLSERVVLVLSSKYVQDTWFSFEKTLKQLTQMSLHNQRIMGVLLEDCVIPDSLGELYFLDASDPDFFHVFTKRLKTSKYYIDRYLNKAH